MDVVSRFLAGLPERDRPDSFSPQRTLSAWQRHAATLNALFADFERQYARPAAEWAGSALAGKRKARVVFYPFSGPDFTFAHLLFPAAETYILCGLESCEVLADSAAFANGGLAQSLDEVAANLSHFLRQSYFVTKDMREHLETGVSPGVAPVLLVLLARAGMRIDFVTRFDLPAGAGSVLQMRETPGLRIDFHDRRKRRRLFYFRQDLRDAFFEEESAFSRFVSGFGHVATFLKSASYLLHEPNFSHIRELIFERSSMLVQDPSSMPYRTLAEKGWTVDLHGRHVEAPASFRKYEQADLVRASGAGGRSLGFGIGYHTDPRSAALIVGTPAAASARPKAGALLRELTPARWDSDDNARSSRDGLHSDAESA